MPGTEWALGTSKLLLTSEKRGSERIAAPAPRNQVLMAPSPLII